VKKFIQITVIALLSGFLLLGAFSGGVVFGHFSQISALDTLATKTDLGLTVLSTPVIFLRSAH